MLSNSWFKKYLLPGFIFQSLVIGGGYGTGRELVEFFLLLGPKNGILGMIVSMIIWCVVLACTFELSRQFRSYDYRSFLIKILGSGFLIFKDKSFTGNSTVSSFPPNFKSLPRCSQ